MTSLIDRQAPRPEGHARTLIIDTDTHNFPLPPDVLPYLSDLPTCFGKFARKSLDPTPHVVIAYPLQSL